MVNESVLEAVGFLHRRKPCVELFRLSDGGGQTTARSMNGVLRMDSFEAYMRGQGASRIICSQTAPPSCWPMVWISSKIMLGGDIAQFKKIGRYVAWSHRLILGVHDLARGGERSIVANISGTVTRIWQFWGLCTR